MLMASLCLAGRLHPACASSGPVILGGTTVGSLANHYAQKVSLGAAAVVSQLQVHSTVPDTGTIMALYEDKAGAPGRRIATSLVQAVGSGWTPFPLDPKPALEAGTYWIAINGLIEMYYACTPSLGALYAANSAVPGHADFFETPAANYVGFPMVMDYCAINSLAQALDNSSLVFSLAQPGAVSWTAQSAVSNDGIDAAAAVLGNGEETSLSTSVDGPGTLSFYWSAATGGDDSRLIFSVDGGFDSYIAGAAGWAQVNRTLGAGRKELQWRMVGADAGTHYAYLDQVVWTPFTPTPTASPTASPTPSPTLTSTPTPTDTPTPSFTPTQSPSASPTPSPSSSATPSYTPSATFSDTPLVTATPSFTPTFTRTPGEPAALNSSLSRTLLGPVPVAQGRPLCLQFKSSTFAALLELYNSAGEKAAIAASALDGQRCLDTSALAPGVYWALGSVRYLDGSSEALRQKVVILKP